MLRSMLGLTLCLGLVALCSCRTSHPPKIMICLGDGLGGAECKMRDGSFEYWPPSKLKNAWISSQEDMAAFSAWCYDVKITRITKEMEKIKRQIAEADFDDVLYESATESSQEPEQGREGEEDN